MDALARQDSAAIGEVMGAYMTEKSGPFAAGGNFAGVPTNRGFFWGERRTGDEDKTSFSKSHTEFVHSLLRTPTEGSGGSFSYAALRNFIPEASSGYIIGKQNSSASSDTKDGANSPGNYLTIALPFSSPRSRNSLSPRPLYFQDCSSPPLSTLHKPSGRRNRGAPSDITDLDAVKEYVKKAALSAWHPTSTCAMLPFEKGGVVSEKLI
ncbi:putative aryl-alcohol dehydrogenase protein [Botrytis fragariae]|uniref:Putative aryl-alcohol dehydrogenase protein n=1 Tax=Botrytis fragariae TaxID=1964551 RepID=A0A8H6EJ41_9HELO|nr:putative aryl-alcohol dehydrogenase protein [Botrytis fragariae]KAF5874126.1 putative aryl-alcohol dehydrogenase protein [Botrytis fragariae]